MNLLVSTVSEDELEAISEFINDIFIKHVAPDYSAQGIKEFNKVIKSGYLKRRIDAGDVIKKFSIDDKIVGICQINQSHIVLLFVDNSHQSRGIGRLMIDWIKKGIKTIRVNGFVTVNSAPNSIRFYEKAGFVSQDIEQEKNGIKFVPMKLNL